MILLALCLFIVNVVQPHSPTIDINSIHVVPELYQVCWKQNLPKKLDVLKGTNSNGIAFVFRVFSDKARHNYYCIMKKDINSIYTVQFPIEGNNEIINIQVQLKFYLPLGPPLKFIRKKIFSNGVQFQLHRDFAGIINEKVHIFCNGLISYSLHNITKFIQFYMESSENTQLFHPMDPGSAFNTYYSCKIAGWTLSSSFITNKGVIFSTEVIAPLYPVVQFPFRRFLVISWQHSKSYNHSYYTVISEVTEDDKETCLKMFRLCSNSELHDRPFWKMAVPRRCNKDIILEDIGSYDEGSEILVVLDMVHPLKADTKHKLTIFYQNISTSKVEENFIYFETSSNENSGYILNTTYKYRPILSHEASTMNQRLLSDFPDNPVNTTSLVISDYFEKEIIQSVSVKQNPKTNASGPFNYKNILEECGNRCEEGFYPYFYIILKKDMASEKVEIISLAKMKTAPISTPQMTSDSKTYTFTISWNITNYPHGVTPGFFAIMMKIQSTCSSLHIIMCKTCNKVAEFNLSERISNLTKLCKSTIIWKDHYEANAKFITFTTPEMLAEVIFQAAVIPFHLYTQGLPMLSPSNFIKESFWDRGGYILTIAIVSVIGMIILISIGVYIKHSWKTIAKEQENDEDNYYHEEEL